MKKTNVVFELDIDFKRGNMIMAQNGSSGVEYNFKNMRELKEDIIEYILDYLYFMAREDTTSESVAKLFNNYVKEYDEKK